MPILKRSKYEKLFKLKKLFEDTVSNSYDADFFAHTLSSWDHRTLTQVKKI